MTRLVDLGIEPYLVASSLLGVLAQRLVRRNCPQSSVPAEPTEGDLLQISDTLLPIDEMRTGKGCPACRQTGYRGRFAISELLSVSETIRSLIQQQSNASQIQAAAVKEGMTTLRDDDLQQIITGRTTFDEVARVTMAALEA